MKPEVRIHVLTSVLAGALALTAPAARAAEDQKNPPASPATTHTMFMGLDLSLPNEGKNVPILDVSDDAFIIGTEGNSTRIPTKGRNLRLQVNHALKLSDGAATVEKLSAVRGYTPEKDPYRKFERAAGAAGSVGPSVDMASAGLRGNEIAYALATGIVNSGAYAPGAAAAQAQAAQAIDQAYSDISSASAGSFAAQNQTSTHYAKLQEELAEENFDALDIEFQVSSPVPLSTPYVVIVVKYHEREQRADDGKTWIVSKALAPLDQQPRKVRFQQGGLPVGYILDDYQVHLFNKGQEIATTVAPMRTTLSADEAFQYRVVDYVSSHREATLPAAPAAGQISEPLRHHLTTKYTGQPVYVKVLPTGRAERAFADKACKQPIEDTTLDTMLTQVRFDPALDKGKPVKGVVMLVGKGSA